MKFPLTVGGLLGIAGFLVMTSGYGVALYYSWLALACFLLVLSIPGGTSWHTWRAYVARLGIITTLFAIGTAAGLGVLIREKRATCRALAPVLAQLDARRKSTGSYPDSLSGISLPPGLEIRVNKTTYSGINLAGINECDALFYLSPDSAYCIVPVTKLLPISITRFYAYQWSTEQSEWSIQKLIWLLGGFSR